jgi:hypothetical protein
LKSKKKKHIRKKVMSFFFGSTLVKESLSVEVIKAKIETYQRIINEPLDYLEEDYVILKSEVVELKLVKESDSTSYLYPELCYILDVDVNQGPVTAAYLFKNKLVIGTIKRNYYKKKTCDRVIPEDFERFVKDKSVSKWITPGELVRARLHYPVFDYDLHSSSSIMSANAEKVFEPVIVMKNKAGLITIAGCTQKDGSFKEHTVQWYTIAPYVG